MKTFKQHILEKLKISKIETNYKPKNKEELVDLIIAEIEANGPECSLNHIDVSNITDMSYLFVGGDNIEYFTGHPILSKFNGDISNWNVSRVTDMSNMFSHSRFNGDISDWDVSNVTNMDSMFYDSMFNSDISTWDVSNVIDMDFMFTYSNFNRDISNWDVSSLKNIDHTFDRSPLENNPPKWYKK